MSELSSKLRNQVNREVSAAKKAAGLTYFSGRGVEESAYRLMELIPADVRNLTQRICGDPIPGDPRRPWVVRELQK